jgi:hypothetical protein
LGVQIGELGDNLVTELLRSSLNGATLHGQSVAVDL